MENIIGEKGIKVILLHIQLGDYLESPAKLHRDLLTIFGGGAEHIEKRIVKELFGRLNLPFKERENFNFGTYIERARELFMARMKGSSRRQASFAIAEK